MYFAFIEYVPHPESISQRIWQGIVKIEEDERGFVVAERINQAPFYFLTNAQQLRRDFSLGEISHVRWIAKAESLEKLSEEIFEYLL